MEKNISKAEFKKMRIQIVSKIINMNIEVPRYGGSGVEKDLSCLLKSLRTFLSDSKVNRQQQQGLG